MEVLQVLDGGDGRLVGIPALVDVFVLVQIVIQAGRPDELPEPEGPGRRQGQRLEQAFDDRKPDQIVREAGLPKLGRRYNPCKIRTAGIASSKDFRSGPRKDLISRSTH